MTSRGSTPARFRAATAWSADRVGNWAPWLVFLALLLLSIWTPLPTEPGAAE